jgi:hypothetical protein
VLRESTDTSNTCRRTTSHGVRGCARDWGRWLGQSGGAKTFGGVGIDDRRRRRLRVFDEEFVGLERFFAREKKGE